LGVARGQVVLKGQEEVVGQYRHFSSVHCQWMAGMPAMIHFFQRFMHLYHIYVHTRTPHFAIKLKGCTGYIENLMVEIQAEFPFLFIGLSVFLFF